MVDSISNTPNSRGAGQPVGGGIPAASSAKTITKTEFSAARSERGEASAAGSDKVVAPPTGNAATLASQALSPPFTSLALYKDAESGLQVAVIRDKMTGEVEQIPTERMRRLAALYREQEEMAAHRRSESSSSVDI